MPPRARVRTRARSPRPAWPAQPPGEQIFTAAGCGACHTFGKAGTKGNIGPNLDELAAQAGNRTDLGAEEYVSEAILDPDAFTVEGFQSGVMPAYEGRLNEKQVQALVEYLLGN